MPTVASLTILNNFPWHEPDDQRSIIEMFDSNFATAKGSEKINVKFSDEVVLLALEAFMGLLVNDNDDVSRLYIRGLVTLSVENDGLTAFHALVYVHLENLLLREDLLTLAITATILGVYDFAGTITFVARGLHLLDHRAHLANNELDTTSVTSATRPHGTFLATTTITF